MIKIMRASKHLEMAAMVGIDPHSDGLARAARLGVPTTARRRRRTARHAATSATSASSSTRRRPARTATQRRRAAPHGKRVIDLTPGGDRPVSSSRRSTSRSTSTRRNVNMVTCGGQATIPIVAAVARVAPVSLRRDRRVDRVEVGRPGHARQHRRVHRDDGAGASKVVGGAKRGKAIIILNPAEPPLIMRDTVFASSRRRRSPTRSRTSVDGDGRRRAARTCRATGSSSRCSSSPSPPTNPLHMPESRRSSPALQVSVFLEVEGAAHYLPAYAGNLDIMTSAALAIAERIAGASRRA